MKYLDLVQSSARQAITNKFAWLSIFATLIGQILPSLSESVPAIKYVSSEIWFLSAVMSIVLVSGLVYSVSQKELNDLETPALYGWRKGWSKIIQVGLLNILFLIVLVIVLFLIGLILNRSIPYAPRTMILAFLLRPVSLFGICTIIIDNGSMGASVRTSVSMFARNAWQTLVTGGVFIVIQQILLGIIIAFILISPYRDLLLDSSAETSFSYFKILEVPQVIFCDQVLSLIMYPWIAVTFTHLYLRFINDSEYAVRSLRQEAA
jgi:hypothetical protein